MVLLVKAILLIGPLFVDYASSEALQCKGSITQIITYFNEDKKIPTGTEITCGQQKKLFGFRGDDSIEAVSQGQMHIVVSAETDKIGDFWGSANEAIPRSRASSSRNIGINAVDVAFTGAGEATILDKVTIEYVNRKQVILPIRS